MKESEGERDWMKEREKWAKQVYNFVREWETTADVKNMGKEMESKREREKEREKERKQKTQQSEKWRRKREKRKY